MSTKRAAPDKASSPPEPEPQGLDPREEAWRQMNKARETLWYALLGAGLSFSERSSRAFDELVEKGAAFQNQAGLPPSSSPEEDLRAQEETSSAVDRLQRLETQLEDRLDKSRDSTLHWIGVPSWKDFATLQQEVENLRQRIQQLEAQATKSQTARQRGKKTSGS